MLFGLFNDDRGFTQVLVWVLQAQVKVKSIGPELASGAYVHNRDQRGTVLCRRRTELRASSWGQGEKDRQISVPASISTVLIRALFWGMIFGSLAVMMLHAGDHVFYVQGTRSFHSSSIVEHPTCCYWANSTPSDALCQDTGTDVFGTAASRAGHG